MTVADLCKELREIKIPATFAEFEKSIKPPYAVYICESDEDIRCDGQIVNSMKNIRLELYVNRRDCTSEAAVKSLLKREEITYETDKTWIAEDKLCEIIFYFQTETEELN